jgi:hypothetical protein
MMLFDTLAQRLALEAIDRRASSSDIRDALAGWFEGRRSVCCIDVAAGAGAGANVRALAPLLPMHQSWTLVIASDAERAAALDHLTRWAPAATITADGVQLERGGLALAIRFAVPEFAAYSALSTGDEHDLVIIDESALDFPPLALQQLASRAARGACVVHARGLYNGRLKIHPHHAADNAFTAALHRQLMAPGPNGEAAGPLAILELSEQLKLSGYTVIEGSSDVIFKAADAPLLNAVLKRMADAQRAVAKGHDAMIDTWLKRPRSTLQVCRSDLIAFPPRKSER